MAKEVIISNESINSYGTRVITAGIDLTQFTKNPIMLYMHERGWSGRMPIGTIENMRVDGDKLIGTPVFDSDDELAVKIERKWDKGVLRMASAGIEPIEYSTEPELIRQGQSRATITKSKLVEVSIVDLGSNDDALQLYHSDGNILQLSAGVENDFIPLLKPKVENTNNQNNLKMENFFLALGLPATATEEQALSAITKLQGDAQKAEVIELSRITSAVDRAIESKRTTADQKEHFITLGKAAGFDALDKTLSLLKPVQKPNEFISQGSSAGTGAVQLKYSELPEGQLREMRENDREGYIKLYKEEFGFAPEL